MKSIVHLATVMVIAGGLLLALLFNGMVLPGSNVQAQEPGTPDQEGAAPQNEQWVAPSALSLPQSLAGGMPDYPLPEKPIPYHRTGHPARSENYTTTITATDETGAPQTIELSGVDALAADLNDPLAGNPVFLGKDQFMMGSYYGDGHLELRSFYNPSVGDSAPGFAQMPGTWENFGPASYAYDTTAADLNGDGRDERIVAWVRDGHILLRTGEMAGQPGRTTSAPAAVSPAPGIIDVVVRGYDDSFWHRRFNGSTWGGWENADGIMASAPAVVATADGGFDLFGLTFDNQEWSRHFDGSAWTTGWARVGNKDWPYALPASLPDSPAIEAPAVARQGTYVHMVRLAPDNTVRYKYSADMGSSWSDWVNLGGTISGGLGAAMRKGMLWVWGRGVDGQPWARYVLWPFEEEWAPVGPDSWPKDEKGKDVTIAAGPSWLGLGDGSSGCFFMQGSDNKPYKFCLGDTKGWQVGTGTIASGVAPILWNGQWRLYAQQTDGRLTESPDLQTWWGDWQALAPCCREVDTGLVVGYQPAANGFQDNTVDVEAGYFLGDGRMQIAIAYRKSQNDTELAVFRMTGMWPWTPPLWVITIPFAVNASITTGDFIGQDGLDDVAMAYTFDNRPGTTATRGMKVIRLGGRILTSADIESVTQGSACTEGMMSAGTVEATSGDFDGDGQEEIAASYVFSCPGPRIHGYAAYTDRPRFRTRVYKVTGSHGTLSEYKPGSLLSDWEHPKDLGIWENDAPAASLGVSIASGDVNHDGRDEIVRTWPVTFGEEYGPREGYYLPWTDRFVRRLQVIVLPLQQDKGSGWTVDENGYIKDVSDTDVFTTGWSIQSYRDKVAVGDLDRDLEDEIVVTTGHEWSDIYEVKNGLSTLRAYKGNLHPDKTVSYDPIVAPKPLEFDNPYVTLIAGSFTGERVRTGKPAYRIQNSVDSMVAIVNAPPKHLDYFKPCETCAYQLLKVRMDSAATYDNTTGTESATTTQVQRVWSIGAGLDAKVSYGGAFIDTNLKYTYGENFSASMGTIKAYNYTQSATADQFDQVAYFGTPYKIWEYPVYDGDSATPEGYLRVVFPAPDLGSTPAVNFREGNNVSLPRYRLGHQPNNVWSYDAFGSDYKECDPERTRQAETGGNTKFGMTFSEIESSDITTNKSHKFNAEVGAGYESPEVAEDALGIGGNFRVSVKGDYEETSVVTEKQTTTKQTQINFNFGNAGAYQFNTKWIVCIAKDGSTLLDYQTSVPTDNSSLWNHDAQDPTMKRGYLSPDPAFILPYAPYTEDGQEWQVPAPGLEQFSPEIQIDPVAARVGAAVTITATVRNFSNKPVSWPFKVRFCSGKPDCQPGDASYIGEQVIPRLDRNNGPQTAVIDGWPAAGSGEQKIYAIIDPGNVDVKEEIHDENDLINNNVAYGVLTVGDAKFADPGEAGKTGYITVGYVQDHGPSVAAYVPPGNLAEVVNFVLRDSPSSVTGQTIGRPFEFLAVAGQETAPQPDLDFQLCQNGEPPAVIRVNGDGASSANVKLYRESAGSSVWEEATCSPYTVQRVAQPDEVLVPVCRTGTYVLSATPPTTVTHKAVFLPLIRR